MPPELLVEKNPRIRQEKRVEWMTSQLLRAREAEAAILRINADLERRVSERTADLQAAFRDMEAFSYSISHDLRAPLRAIEGFSGILIESSEGRLNDEGQRCLDRILRNVQRMGQLIDDLLSFSRVSRSEITRADVDMTAVARSAAEDAGAKSAVIFELPPARGDASLLRQVFVNLLSNAVKFSRKKKSPRIEVGASRDQKRQVVYFVRDNGVGFDVEHASKLFDPFQRFHSQDEFEGTGIGLAIAQRIVQKHGGRIWAEGRPGEGATFYFTLPAESSSPEPI